MNIFNDLPTAFPWYSDIKKQNRYKFNVKLDDWSGLISPSNALLPFQYAQNIPSGVLYSTTLVEWKIFNLSDTLVATIDAANFANVFTTTKENRLYAYYGGQALTVSGGAALNLSNGYYYSKVTFSSALHDDWSAYSEVFYIPECSFLTTTPAVNIPFVKLEWYHDSDLRPIFYNDIVGGVPRFRNIIYLDTFVHQSEPEVIQEGEKDGNDEVVPTFEKCLLKYSLTELVPDYLKMALVVMQMHDHVKFTSEYGIRSGEVQKINSVNSTPQEGGAFSQVEILFEEDVAMVKKSCADNMA